MLRLLLRAAAFWICCRGLLIGQQTELGAKTRPQWSREQGQRTVVVGDSKWLADHDKFLSFFSSSNGRSLKIVNMDEKSSSSSWPALKQFDEFLYENVIVGSVDDAKFPSKDFVQEALELVGDKGGSLLLLGVEGGQATGTRRSPALAVLNALRVKHTASAVVDVVENFNGDKNRVVVTVAEKGVFADPALDPQTQRFEYRGRGFAVGPKQKGHNSLVQPAVVASPTTFVPLQSGGYLSDRRLMLIFALETRSTGGRIVVSGDSDFCGAELWDTNSPLCEAMARWLLLESGVLDWSNFHHFSTNGGSPADLYTQREPVQVLIDLHERRGNSWEPIQSFEPAPILEHVKLDPHWRLVMQRDDTQRQTFKADLKLPEDHGIFKFVITMHQRWWTGVWQEMVAPVRTFRHDDHPRFIPLALPYYFGCFVTIGLLVVFCALYTLLQDEPAKQKAA